MSKILLLVISFIGGLFFSQNKPEVSSSITATIGETIDKGAALARDAFDIKVTSEEDANKTK